MAFKQQLTPTGVDGALGLIVKAVGVLTPLPLLPHPAITQDRNKENTARNNALNQDSRRPFKQPHTFGATPN